MARFAPRARYNPPNVYPTTLRVDGIITTSMFETPFCVTTVAAPAQLLRLMSLVVLSINNVFDQENAR